MNPFFSIIIPTYNSASFIGRCLDSIVSQHFKDFEILIMDGNSKDESLAIINEYRPVFDHKLRVYSEADKGVYDAMNKGIRLAKGKWLYFLGSDDYLIDPEVLGDFHRKIVEAKKKIDIIYGNVFSEKLGRKYDGRFNFEKLLYRNICHQAIFYSREVFAISGGYNLRYYAAADHEFNLRCFADKKIRKQYYDRMVAFYSEGGLSESDHNDPFTDEMKEILAGLGYKVTPLRKLKKIFWAGKMSLETGERYMSKRGK